MSALSFHSTTGWSNWWKPGTDDRRFFAIAVPDYDEYRACALCDHHTRYGNERCCRHPDVALVGVPAPITMARSRSGGCGPEAIRMSTPWLR
jgi:hypothetical protein